MNVSSLNGVYYQNYVLHERKLTSLRMMYSSINGRPNSWRKLKVSGWESNTGSSAVKCRSIVPLDRQAVKYYINVQSCVSDQICQGIIKQSVFLLTLIPSLRIKTKSFRIMNLLFVHRQPVVKGMIIVVRVS